MVAGPVRVELTLYSLTHTQGTELVQRGGKKKGKGSDAILPEDPEETPEEKEIRSFKTAISLYWAIYSSVP